MAAHCGRQWAHQFHLWHDWCMLFAIWHSKSLPPCLMGTCQKKRHRNSQYWWRYWHLLLVTVVNSEQDMWHSDRNQLHFLQSNMVDRCISIWGICSKKRATNIFNIQGDTATSFCSSPWTVSSYFLKRQCRSALISFFGNLPLDPKVYKTLSISFFRNLTLKIKWWISQWDQHQTLSYNHS